MEKQETSVLVESRISFLDTQILILKAAIKFLSITLIGGNFVESLTVNEQTLAQIMPHAAFTVQYFSHSVSIFRDIHNEADWERAKQDELNFAINQRKDVLESSSDSIIGINIMYRLEKNCESYLIGYLKMQKQILIDKQNRIGKQLLPHKLTESLLLDKKCQGWNQPQEALVQTVLKDSKSQKDFRSLYSQKALSLVNSLVDPNSLLLKERIEKGSLKNNLGQTRGREKATTDRVDAPKKTYFYSNHSTKLKEPEVENKEEDVKLAKFVKSLESKLLKTKWFGI